MGYAALGFTTSLFHLLAELSGPAVVCLSSNDISGHFVKQNHLSELIRVDLMRVFGTDVPALALGEDPVDVA